MTSVTPRPAAWTSAALDLSGKRALVTGGASGIGRACARLLAGAGARVVGADVDGDAARAAAAEIGGVPLLADLSDVEGLDGIAAGADIVVNNAGVQHVAPVHEFPPEVFARIQRLMVEAPFRLVREALPGMYER